MRVLLEHIDGERPADLADYFDIAEHDPGHHDPPNPWTWLEGVEVAYETAIPRGVVCHGRMIRGARIRRVES